MPAVATIDLSQLPGWAHGAASRLAGLTFAPALQRCKLLLVSHTKRNFASGTAPDGTAWLPLARPRNRARDRRARGGSGQKPLRDTGILMGSVTAGGPGHVEQLTASELVWGTALDYAGVHQYGATISRPERRRAKPWVFTSGGETVFTRRIRAHTITIPPRPFLGWNDELADGCAKILADYYTDQIGRSA